jgi:hypothetical protein
MAAPSDHWTIRVRGTRDAQTRSRLAFAAAVIVAIALAMTQFNSTYSWFVGFMHAERFPANEIKREAQKAFVEQWTKSTRMTIPWLGIDFGASDAAILGSISLAIITLWFYVCIRRENHLIAELLIDAERASHDTKLLVFHGIASYLLFTSISDHDEPIDSLAGHDRADQRKFFLRPTLKLLIFLPAITIAFIVISDILSLILSPSVRASGESLFQTILREPETVVRVAMMESIALVFGTARFSLCSNISRFEEATGKIMKEFHDHHIVRHGARAGSA